MTDTELSSWLDRQVEERRRVSAAADPELDSLRLLRDALVREVRGTRPKRKVKGRRATTGRR